MFYCTVCVSVMYLGGEQKDGCSIGGSAQMLGLSLWC